MPKDPVSGPFVVFVVPEKNVRIVRPADCPLPCVEVIDEPGDVNLLPYVALATFETPCRHSQLNFSSWAMTPEDGEVLVGRLRDLADFIEAAMTTADAAPA